ncbi:MAG: plasmid replication protein RepC [Planctomycetota bacterium]
MYAPEEPSITPDADATRLDRTVDRYRLLLLAKRVGKEWGFTPRMLQLLEYYLAYTTAVDWEEGSRPIVFQSLARTAMDLGVGERQIQKLEKRLFEVGAIAWNDSGNHKRFGRRDPRSGRLLYAYGVDLTPLARLEEALEARLHEKQLYAEAWRATKREISEQRRKIRTLLTRALEEGADAEKCERFEAAYQAIAIELRSHFRLERLRELLDHHQELLAALEVTLGPADDHRTHSQTNPSPIVPPTQKHSRSHALKFAHQEPTTLRIKEGERPAGGRQEEEGGNPEPSTTARQPQQALWTLGQALHRAGQGLREHLPPSKRPTTWSDLVEAAHRRRRDLRISQRSWSDACRRLGRPAAAVCLIQTDRAVNRTTNPASHPDAYFRGVVRKSELGTSRR